MTLRRALTASTLRLLREGRRCACHRSGKRADCYGHCTDLCVQSEEPVTLRVLAGMVNCGWPEEDCWVALLDPAALGGRFLQGMNARNAVRARRWLARQYANTGRWAASSPAGDRLHDTLVLADVAAGLESAAGFSPGPKGVTERAVLRSLVEQGRQRSSVTWTPSAWTGQVAVVCRMSGSGRQVAATSSGVR